VSRRAQENLIAGFVLAIFVAAIIASLQYGPRARLVPIPIATLGVVLMVAQIVMQNVRSEKDLKIDLLEVISRQADGLDESSETGAADEGSGNPGKGNNGKQLAWAEAQALGIVVLLAALFIAVGPLPAMFLFTAGYFALSRHYTVVKSLVYAAAYTLLVYAIFSLWLRVDLMRGMIDVSFGLI
jgi:hypothetical protein